MPELVFISIASLFLQTVGFKVSIAHLQINHTLFIAAYLSSLKKERNSNVKLGCMLTRLSAVSQSIGGSALGLHSFFLSFFLLVLLPQRNVHTTFIQIQIQNTLLTYLCVCVCVCVYVRAWVYIQLFICVFVCVCVCVFWNLRSTSFSFSFFTVHLLPRTWPMNRPLRWFWIGARPLLFLEHL